MSKAKFEAAKELIQTKQYAEARGLLKTIDHPMAREWEARIEHLNPQSESSTKINKTRGKKVKMALLGAGLLIIAIFALSQVQDNARINQNMEQMKRNNQIVFDAIEHCSGNAITEVREACVESYKIGHGYIYTSSDEFAILGTPTQDRQLVQNLCIAMVNSKDVHYYEFSVEIDICMKQERCKYEYPDDLQTQNECVEKARLDYVCAPMKEEPVYIPGCGAYYTPPPNS